MTQQKMTQRKLDGYIRLAEIINWGRMYPIKFMERFLGIQFLDYQKYILMNSWTTKNILWCMSRSAGKTFLAVPFIMAKSMLIPNHSTYILAGTASQSQNLFLKLEKTAKKEIESLTGLTDIFANEIVRTNSLSDGFIHEQSQYKCSLYNGSTITSLSGAYDRNRGKYKLTPKQLYN